MRFRFSGCWLFLVLVACRSGKPTPKFETSAVDRGQITSKVTATGTLSARVTVQVGTQVSGRVSELHVDFNSRVKKGQVLAKLDQQSFQALLDQAIANAAVAEGNLEKAKVQLAEAEREAARQKALFDKELISKAEADTGEAAAAAARAQVSVALGSLAQAKAARRQAEVNLNYTTITSPINGLVISRNVELGQTVAASLQAPVLFILAEDLSHMQVDTSVSEADVGRLTEGMSASFRVDAYPTQRFPATLRQIRNAAQTTQNVVTYDGVLDVENLELKLKPGMTANVTFTAAQKDNVLRVSNAALRFRMSSEALAALGVDAGTPRAAVAEGGRETRVVWKIVGGRPVPVPIKTGITDGSFTEVVDGALTEADLLVTEVTGLTPKPGGPGASPLGGPPPGPQRRGGL
jgi:HlyD family secretion protein